MKYKKIRFKNEEEYKVTLDMVKLFDHCERYNIDITECIKIEICKMEDAHINSDRRYTRNHAPLLDEYKNKLVGESVENTVIRNLTFNQLDYYLKGCTEKQRRRFIMNKIQGYTYCQIAETENVSRCAVAMSISKAKRCFIENGKNKFNID